MKYRTRQREDIQRQYPAGECGRCGKELYPGDSCWTISGVLLCKACLLDYALGFFAPYRDEVEK